MSTEEPIVVYWGAMTAPDRQTRVNLMWDPPVRLSEILPGAQSKEGSYRACTAARQMVTQTYAFLHPVTSTTTVSGDFDDPQIESTFNAWTPRPAPFKNQYGIDYDFTWLFFSEESVVMKQTPPYLHNSSERSSATLAAGAYDISKWFRPLNASYIFWEGQTSLTVTAGEPVFYIDFQTDRKVILKHFEVTPEIHQLASETAFHKQLFPKESFDVLYSRFTKSHRDKRVIKLIKDNLLE